MSRKATVETAYHVASVTKVFTTSLAAMLHDRAVIDLDQPAVKYLPKDVSISTRPELGDDYVATAGVPHVRIAVRDSRTVQSVEGRYQLEPKRLYELLADAELVFDPGTDELYSNLGVGLLGHVLELSADKSFDRLLQEIVCEPLHLERTVLKLTTNSGWRPAIQLDRGCGKSFVFRKVGSFGRAGCIGWGSGKILGGANEARAFLQRDARAASYALKAVERCDGQHGVRMVGKIERDGWPHPWKRTAAEIIAARGSVSRPTTAWASR